MKDIRFWLAWPIVVLATSVVVASPGEPVIDEAGGQPAGYRLVWWSYDVSRNRTGWANDEPQYYAAARRENSQRA